MILGGFHRFPIQQGPSVDLLRGTRMLAVREALPQLHLLDGEGDWAHLLSLSGLPICHHYIHHIDIHTILK